MSMTLPPVPPEPVRVPPAVPPAACEDWMIVVLPYETEVEDLNRTGIKNHFLSI